MISRRYQDAVDYFVKHPDEIEKTWLEPSDNNFGYLFGYLGNGCGCPSIVKHFDKIENNFYKLPNQEITGYVQSLNLPLPFFNNVEVINRCFLAEGYKSKDPSTLTRKELEQFALAQMKNDEINDK